MSNRLESAANQLRSQINDFDSPDILMKKRARFVLKAADRADNNEGVVRVSAKSADLTRAAEAVHVNMCACNRFEGPECFFKDWDYENAFIVLLNNLKVES